jgi:hypothetical protein
MGGEWRLDNYIICKSHKEMMFLKNKLNSEIVKSEEPEKFEPIWSETYRKTHLKTTLIND